MKIFVCIKPVPVASANKSGTVNRARQIMNPLDRLAIQESLRLGGEITAVSMAPQSGDKILREAIALGANRAVLLSDILFAGADSQATADVLAAFIKRENFDLIVCGFMSTDGNTAQVPVSIAARLEIPYSLNEYIGKKSVMIVSKSLACPQAPTIAGILRSRSADIKIISAKDLGFSEKPLSPTRVAGSAIIPLRARKSEEISTEKLLEILRAPAPCKAAKTSAAPVSKSELRHDIWICMADDYEFYEISRMAAPLGSIVRIDSDDKDEIVNLAQQKTPWAILFPANMQCRLAAPWVASKLKTGITADCTDLFADGDNLIARRPAFSGAILADIVCDTRPQIATVRVPDCDSKIIFAGGRGLGKEGFEIMRAAASKFGAEIGATRAAVDSGYCEYPLQIGQSGRMVAPRIYIAFGISGELEHTNGIMESEIIVAVNINPNTPIMKIADYKIETDAKEVLKCLMNN